MDDGADRDQIGLPEAIRSLRADLAEAWREGQGQQIRFTPGPVELTVQMGVTWSNKGYGGIKWYVLSIGGEHSKEAATTQTLKLQITPVLFDDQGKPLPDSEQFVSDRDQNLGVTEEPVPEPE